MVVVWVVGMVVLKVAMKVALTVVKMVDYLAVQSGELMVVAKVDSRAAHSGFQTVASLEVWSVPQRAVEKVDELVDCLAAH